MTIQNLYDMVRYRTNTNTVTATDTNLQLIMNERHRQLWLALQDVREDYGMEIATTNMIAGQQEYALPDDCMKIKRVELTFDGTTWVWGRFFDVNERQNANDSTTVNQDFQPGSPRIDVGDKSLWIFPVPDQTLNMKGATTVTNGIKMYYFRRPQDAGTDKTASLTLPKEFHAWMVDLMSVDVEVNRGRISIPEAEEMEKNVMEAFKKTASPRVQGQKVNMKAYYQNHR